MVEYVWDGREAESCDGRRTACSYGYPDYLQISGCGLNIALERWQRRPCNSLDMSKGERNLITSLIITVCVLGIWGMVQNNRKNQLEWELDIYKERLSGYEDPANILSVIDSLNEDYAVEVRNEEKASRSR